MAVRIEAATSVDLDAMCALLETAGLPTDGLEEHLTTALVARDGETVIGCVALEDYGDLALLRSLVVTALQRHRGIGQRLTRGALELARRRGMVAVYLLTTTAAGFFADRFGFTAVDRVDVPAPVRQSVQFVGACPDTAQAMVRDVPALEVPR